MVFRHFFFFTVFFFFFFRQFVLSQVKSWSVSVSALNLRSRVEKDSRRRVERSMMQLEVC